MPKPTKSPEKPEALAAKVLRNKDLGKKRYKQSDAGMVEFLKSLPTCAHCGNILVPKEPITLPTGKKVALVDNFAKKHSMGVGLSARRYEFEEITTP